MNKVKALQAFYIFNTLKGYKEAIELLQSIQASPLDVINLYSDYESFDSNALQLLLDYLTIQRAHLTTVRTRILEGDLDDPDLLQVCEAVDNTLLKLYFQLNEYMIRPLLRIPNLCSIQDCQRLFVNVILFMD
jgi:hypothetical protein